MTDRSSRWEKPPHAPSVMTGYSSREVKRSRVGRPGELHIPNATTREAMEEARTMPRARFATAEELFKSLDELLEGYDPEKHRHAPMLDDGPVGNETNE